MENKTRHNLLIPPFLLKLDHLLEEILLPVIGIILIGLAAYITAYVGYLMGGGMLLFGALMLGHAIYHKEYLSIDTHNTAIAVSLIIMGVVVLVKHDDCIAMLGYIWGIYGIYFGIEDLTELFHLVAHRKKCWFVAFETIFGLVLSVLLLMHPVHHFETHVRILGFELIIASLHAQHFRHEIPEEALLHEEPTL